LNKVKPTKNNTLAPWFMLTLSAVLVVSLVDMINLVYGVNDNSSILNNGIVSPTDPEISCNKMNSNCHFIFKNETVKITEELFKTYTISKESLSYGSFIRLKNSINCNPVIDYYIDHNWGPIGVSKESIIMVLVLFKDLG
jgi:hypothetical protein